MNYDITFCEGKGCRCRNNCHRYRELMRYRADKSKNKRNLISMYIGNSANCTLFWAEKGDNNECS